MKKADFKSLTFWNQLFNCKSRLALVKSSWFLILFFPLLLGSCAVANLSSEVVAEQQQSYQRLFPVFVSGKLDLSEINEEVYDAHFKGKFNSFRDADLRLQIEEDMVRNIGDRQTIVVQGSKIFEQNSPVAYHDFLKRLDRYEVDGILVVNLDDYWRSSSAYSDDDLVIHDEDPNAKFYCYLVDRNTLKPVWMARSEVNGIAGGDGPLFFRLTRKVTKDLREKGFLASK